MDLALDNTGDMAIVDGELVWVTDGDAVAQHITMRLRTFLGESVYDRSAGIAYREIILQPGTPNFARESILSKVVLDTPGVTSCAMTVTLDAATHTLYASGTATGINGPVEFSVDFQLEI